MHKNNEFFQSLIAKDVKNTFRVSPALPTACRPVPAGSEAAAPASAPPGRLPFAIRQKRPHDGPAIKEKSGRIPFRRKSALDRNRTCIKGVGGLRSIH